MFDKKKKKNMYAMDRIRAEISTLHSICHCCTSVGTYMYTLCVAVHYQSSKPVHHLPLTHTSVNSSIKTNLSLKKKASCI